MDKIYYRPRSYLIYQSPSFNAKCIISCYPQQRWKQVNSNEECVKLVYKNVSIIIPIYDFEKNWKIVKF